MPRFMSLIRIDEQAAAGFEPDPGLEKRMGALFEEITNAGVMLETAGLAPTSQATRVHWSGGRLSYTDGPFTETKEVVGGYAIRRWARTPCRPRSSPATHGRRGTRTPTGPPSRRSATASPP